MVSAKNPGGHQDELVFHYRLSPSPPNRADFFSADPKHARYCLPDQGKSGQRSWLVKIPLV